MVLIKEVYKVSRIYLKGNFMIIYLACPYTTYGDVVENVTRSGTVASQLWLMGYVVISPNNNTNCPFIEGSIHGQFPGPPDLFLRGDEMIISRCDAVVFLENWEKSDGCRREHAYAKKNNIPIYYYPNLPKISDKIIKEVEAILNNE